MCIAVSIACRVERKENYLASHPPFELDRLAFVDKFKILEDLDPLLVLWNKFQVLFRDCILQRGDL
jgi:hypothetical protein